MQHIVMLSAFILYICILLVIGLCASWFNPANPSDKSSFLIGNRSVNYWVTAISAHAADMSDWLFMGFPAAIYLGGMFNVWVAIGLMIGMFSAWQFIAPAIRRETERYSCNTLPSYFEKKYNETQGRISILSAIIMAFFFTIYVAAGVKGAGYLLRASFGIPYHVGGAIALAITFAYTFMGGYIAAAWVDFFQGLFLLGAILITPILGYMMSGGINAIITAAQSAQVPLTLFSGWHSMLGIILGPITWGLGYLGMPHIISKFMGAHSAQEMHKSKYIGMIWQLLALSGATLTGFVGLALFYSRITRPELLFLLMTQTLLPEFVTGLVLCGILAATLSTINAQSIVFAGVLVDDIYKRFVRPNATQTELVNIFQAAVFTVCVCGYIVAWDEHSTIFNLVQFAWSGLGASFGPLTVMSLYGSGINKYGAFWGILAGGLSAIIWRSLNITVAGFTINEMLPGFIVGLATIKLVSHFTREYLKANHPSKAHI